MHGAFATAILPTIGYVAAGGSFDATFGYLFIVALVTHAWGFTFNDLCDKDVDSQTEYLKGRPLVSGDITDKQARTFGGICLVLSVIMMAYFLNAWVMLFFTISTAFGLLYDLRSKIWHGGDYLIAAWACFLLLAGAAVASGPDTWDAAVWVLWVVSFFNILNFNTMGSVKDLEGDAKAGAPTAAVWFGSGADESGKLKFSKKFRYYALFIRLLFIMVCGTLLFSSMDAGDTFLVLVHVLIFVALSAGNLRFVLSLPKLSDADKKKLWRFMSADLLVAYLLVITSATPLIGIIPAVFFILLPVVWFPLVVYASYGKLVPVS